MPSETCVGLHILCDPARLSETQISGEDSGEDQKEASDAGNTECLFFFLLLLFSFAKSATFNKQ